MVFTKSGRTALATSLKSQPIHLAWGTGNPLWETQVSRILTFADNALQLEHFPVKDLRISQDHLNYTAGEDFKVDLITGLVTRLNLEGPVQVSYTVATPLESIHATTLLREVGRRKVDTVTYCVADPEGLLVSPTGRFSVSETPTNLLHFHTTFDFEDASTETIRELGIFIGTAVAENCPAGQRYFLPHEITDPGILLVCENIVPLIRTPATREAFSFVVTL